MLNTDVALADVLQRDLAVGYGEEIGSVPIKSPPSELRNVNELQLQCTDRCYSFGWPSFEASSQPLAQDVVPAADKIHVTMGTCLGALGSSFGTALLLSQEAINHQRWGAGIHIVEYTIESCG